MICGWVEWAGGQDWEEGITKEYKITLWDNGYVHYLDCSGDDSTGVYVHWNLPNYILCQVNIKNMSIKHFTIPSY